MGQPLKSKVQLQTFSLPASLKIFLDVEGWTALYGASREGHLEIAKFLVANGADIEATGEDFTHN